MHTGTAPSPHSPAEVRLHRLLTERPAEPALHGALAALQLAAGDPGALRSQHRAVLLAPADATARCGLGSMLHLAGLVEAAVACYRAALQLDPGFNAAWYNLAAAYQDLARPEAAAPCYRRALRLQPDDSDAAGNLGQTLQAQGQTGPAALCYRHAIRLRPDHAHALSGLAGLTQMAGDLTAALRLFGRATAAGPGLPDIQSNHAMALLQAGHYREGWEAFEARTALARVGHPPYAGPAWRGEPLAVGSTIVLHAEQGLGDTLQFCRYAPLVADRGGRVVLQVQSPLVRLLTRLPGVAQVLPTGAPVPGAGAYCSLLSLPRAFGTTLATIPATRPYLTADPAAITTWQQRLAGLDGLKVGLVWAGNPRPGDPEGMALDRRRSLSLAALAPLAAVPGVRFVSLQVGAAASQTAGEPAFAGLIDAAPLLGDFADTAAAVMALDLVISVDTAVAHLAGALGRPVWMLSRFDGCWRWLTDRDDSPWYPTLRLFRQPRPGDWPPAIAAVAAALAALSSSGKPNP